MIPTILLDAGELQRMTDERRVRLSVQWGRKHRRRAGREEEAVPVPATVSLTAPRAVTRPRPRHAAPEPLPRLPAPETVLLADRTEAAGPVRSSR